MLKLIPDIVLVIKRSCCRYTTDRAEIWPEYHWEQVRRWQQRIDDMIDLLSHLLIENS